MSLTWPDNLAAIVFYVSPTLEVFKLKVAAEHHHYDGVAYSEVSRITPVSFPERRKDLKLFRRHHRS
jgi:hypothetical protein